MTSKRPQHPSGKPVRTSEYKRLPIPRCPYREPLTPGLQKKHELTNAIGFTAKLTEEFE